MMIAHYGNQKLKFSSFIGLFILSVKKLFLFVSVEKFICRIRALFKLFISVCVDKFTIYVTGRSQNSGVRIQNKS